MDSASIDSSRSTSSDPITHSTPIGSPRRYLGDPARRSEPRSSPTARKRPAAVREFHFDTPLLGYRGGSASLSPVRQLDERTSSPLRIRVTVEQPDEEDEVSNLGQKLKSMSKGRAKTTPSPAPVRRRSPRKRKAVNEEENTTPRKRKGGLPNGEGDRGDGVTTTIVPLKGLESSLNPPTPGSGKRGRGRPRKTSRSSFDRPPTPVPNRTRRRAAQSAQSATQDAPIRSPNGDVDSVDLIPYVAATTEMNEGLEDDEDDDVFGEIAHDGSPVKAKGEITPNQRRTRGRRKAMSAEKLEMNGGEEGSQNGGDPWLNGEEENSQGRGEPGLNDGEEVQGEPMDVEEEAMEVERLDFDEIPRLTPFQDIDQEDSRSPSQDEILPTEESNIFSDTSPEPEHEMEPEITERDIVAEPREDLNEDLNEEPAPVEADTESSPSSSPIPVDHESSPRISPSPPAQRGEESKSQQNTLNPREFDSIMESEEFSMVSISSLPSVQKQLQSSVPQDVSQASEKSKDVHTTNGETNGNADSVEPSGSFPTDELSRRVNLRKRRPARGARIMESIFEADNYPDVEIRDFGRSTRRASTNEPASSPKQNMIENGDLRRSLIGSTRIPKLNGKGLTNSNGPVPVPAPSPPPVSRSVIRDQDEISQTSSLQSPTKSSKKAEGTPKLAHVVKAGIALQGAVGDDKVKSRLFGKRKAPGTPVQAAHGDVLEDLFGGFGQGTQRELRAGLKFGEELARRNRRQGKEQGKAPASRSAEDVFIDQAQSEVSYPQLPRENVPPATTAEPIQDELAPPSSDHRQLPSPSTTPIEDANGDVDVDIMDWRQDTPVKVVTYPQQTQQPETDWDPSLQEDRSEHNETAFSTWEEREERWDRERQAVSQQIENANTSEVIIINDSLAHTEQDDTSIEDDEADELEKTPRIKQEPEEASHQSLESLNQSEPSLPRLKPKIDESLLMQPPRGKIPSPWRFRDKGVVYSDEIGKDDVDEAGRQLEREQREIHQERLRSRKEKERRRTRESWFEFSSDLRQNLSSDPAHSSPRAPYVTPKASRSQLFQAQSSPQEMPSSPPYNPRRQPQTQSTARSPSPSPEPLREVDLTLRTKGEWRKRHWQFLAELYWSTNRASRGPLLPKGQQLPSSAVDRSPISKTVSLAQKDGIRRLSDKFAQWRPSFVPESLWQNVNIFDNVGNERHASSGVRKQRYSLLGRNVTNISGRNLILGPAELTVIQEFRETIRAANIATSRSRRIFEADLNFLNDDDEGYENEDFDSEEPLYIWTELYIARRLFAVIIAAKKREENARIKNSRGRRIGKASGRPSGKGRRSGQAARA